MRSLLAGALILAVVCGSGCTLRYSQSLSGTIPRDSGNLVRSSDSGFSLFSITFSEPTSAHDQVKSLLGACSKLTALEVDYREVFFLIFGIPRVTVEGNCIP